MPYYSFIMIGNNNWNLTRQALNTLLESLDDTIKVKGIELLIINNGSTKETSAGIGDFKKKFSSEFLDIVEIRLPENMGYAIGLNMGLGYSGGEVITILNNDLVFSKGWFNGLVEILQNNNSVGVAVPYLSYAGTVQNVGVLFSSSKEIHKFAEKFMQENKDKVVFADNIISTCVSFRRDLFNLIGGFDFWVGTSMACDIDWSLRANIAGKKIAVVGSSFVYHIGNATFAIMPDVTAMADDYNNPKFILKWNLRGNENPEGLFYSFREIIKNNIYLRKKHYFPTKPSEFNLLPGSLLEKKSENDKSILFIADWNNTKSDWRKGLSNISKQVNPQGEVYLWVPQQYFRGEEVIPEIEKVLPNKNINIKYLFNNIFPIDILRFLKSFDVIFKVENDYVNRYMISFAKEIGLAII
ncbi:MAG: glycosyltransferase family 2 protein [Peptococcales bacterium]|jgi:GT2 family glycosyltransferase